LPLKWALGYKEHRALDEIIGKNAIIVFGAMFATLVAGFFAFMNLIASKEHKVSEFRQDWINSLRDSVSCYISSLTYLSSLYKHYSKKPEADKDQFEMTKGVEEVYAKVNESYNDIIFRINDSEDKGEGKELNTTFLEALAKTRDHYNKNEFSKARATCDPLREATKPLLKFEWKRVKSGEPTYRYSKYFSVFVLCVGISIATVNAFFIWDFNAEIEAETSIEKEPNKKLNKDAAKSAAPVS
jgi:hypothetical protein